MALFNSTTLSNRTAKDAPHALIVCARPESYLTNISWYVALACDILVPVSCLGANISVIFPVYKLYMSV